MTRRAFQDVGSQPCPVCLELAMAGKIQARAVMPLPVFPARNRSDGRECCRDCQATETTMAILAGQHPRFFPARLTIANERLEGIVMPRGMMEHFGLCSGGWIEPCSLDDLKPHIQWLERHGIPNSSDREKFCQSPNSRPAQAE